MALVTRQHAKLSNTSNLESTGDCISFSGELSVHTLHSFERELPATLKGMSGNISLDIRQVEQLDTAGALFINQIRDRLEAEKRFGLLFCTDKSHLGLLEISKLSAEETKTTRKPPVGVVWLNNFGKNVVDTLNSLGMLIGFLGQFLVTCAKIVCQPKRMRWTSLFFHIDQAGVRAVPIVCLLTFLIGMVVAYLGVQEMRRFGAQEFAVNLLEVSVMREMAVLITSIVVAGRSSSAFTAQIGAMVANEEVDAMRSMGLDPNNLLVAPRVLALIISLPMLVFISDIFSLAGGATALWYTLDISFSAFITKLHAISKLNNFMVGMVKTPFFAVVIGLVGCFQGFKATSSAESVGFLTTAAVVQAIFLVILLDALFALLFLGLGV